MRRQLTKIALAAGFMLALAFTLSCSDDGGGSKEPSYDYCITDNNACLTGPFTVSTCTGQLSNSCPYEGLSSSVAGGSGRSSSSATSGGSSSSGGSGDGSSSSATGGGSSSSGGGSGDSSSSATGGDSSSSGGGSGDSSSSATGSGSSSSGGGSVSSSSVNTPKCGTSEYDPGTKFCDSRDDKLYKFVAIGTQTWMAENLNYNASGSKCGNNSTLSDANTVTCNTYGRLYDWSTATALPSSCNSSTCSAQVEHRGICPSGWHIPSDAEWTTLANFVGGNAGTKLKATSGWNSDGNGTDNYGFSALPGGSGNSEGDFGNVGDNGYWWSATENNASYAWFRNMGHNLAAVYRFNGDKTYLYSVRCVQD